jgi:hypothetical protein
MATSIKSQVNILMVAVKSKHCVIKFPLKEKLKSYYSISHSLSFLSVYII